MRTIIVDTDTASDDAVAVIMALCDPGVEVLALTTVSGNVSLDQATKNCLMSAELTGKHPLPPVYMGADRPLMRTRVSARNVHGNDGMSDLGLIHPTIAAVQSEHAANALIRLVEAHPYEVELAVIGPATNVALAMMLAPGTMVKLKHIYTMGTAGFGPGNTTPVAEFNVYADAEAYRVMLDFGVPVTVIGADVCVGDAAWLPADTSALLKSDSPLAHYAVNCNAALRNFSMTNAGEDRIFLCDAVALGCMLWPETIVSERPCVSHVCLNDPATYGQVIFYDGRLLAAVDGFEDGLYGKKAPNCSVVTAVDSALYKRKLYELLTTAS